MQFETTIKLITEAKDRNEAMEIAGEYLSGNLATGVEMKLRAAPRHSNIKRAGFALVISSFILLFAIHLSYIKHPQNIIQNLPGANVIQPPLKTSSAVNGYSDFQKEWQARHTKEALSSFKR